MNNPKVLVAIPYHTKKRYCLSELFNFIDSITYKNKEVVVRFDPNVYGSKDACKLQREYFRKMAIEKGFDYLYFLGADTIPCPDIIEKLLVHEVDVVGGVYWGRAHADNGNTNKAVAWRHDLPLEKQKSLFNGEMMIDKDYPSLIPVDGMGMDCVLFSRKALESFSFLDWEQNDDDYPAYDILKSKGFKVWLDTKIQCKHYYGDDVCEGYSYKAEDIKN